MACLLPCFKGTFNSFAHTVVFDHPQLGDWLESYATALDLNVWLSSSITSTSFSRETRTWQVSINRGGQTRTMTVKHLVFATGFGGGFPNMPDIPGQVGHHCTPSFRRSKASLPWSGIVPWIRSAFYPVYFCDRLWWEEGDHYWRLHFRFGAPRLIGFGCMFMFA